MSATTLRDIISSENPGAKDLFKLKNKVRQDKMLRLHISAQQDVADNADEDLGQTWFKKMAKIMGQIDNHVKYCVPFPKVGRQFRFLDLGCCPGGFSTYILKKNKTSTGLGVSLPPDAGGHAFLMDPVLQERYSVIFSNIVQFQLGLEPVFYPYTHPLPTFPPLPPQLTSREYDLILLDAHQLRNQVDAGALLAVSQIIIALSTTKVEGSTIVMKLSNAETPYTARILFMLYMLSSSLIAYKPYLMHRTKATFYAIARGVGGGAVRHSYLQRFLPQFQTLWKELLTRQNSMFGNHDLDFIASDSDLIAYAPILNDLCRGVWEVQKNALEALSETLGVN
ncbi:hypothetical protein BDZ89DRAFT_987059 [Hymenopellis radicata]|nr:hypothetical protein BDZ89DRAFT_987059 [Hymenopellis radicata]